MTMYGYEALVHAAEKTESEGRWRRAFGFWNEVITKYGSYVSSQELELWKRHRDMCDEKMKQ